MVSRLPRRWGTFLASAVVALAVAASAAAAPDGAGGARRSALSALDAVNSLMADPWTGSATAPGLSQQFRQKTLTSIAALTGKRITHTNGNGWHFDVTLQNVGGSMDISSPPGFSAESPGAFTLAVPLSGSWSIGVSGSLHADGAACCTPVGKNWFSVKGDLPFSFRLSNIRLTAAAQLGTSDPAKPALASATLTARATLSGNGFFPSVPLNLTATIANGKIILGGRITSLGFSIAGVGAQLTMNLTFTILPSQEQEEFELGKTVDLSAAFQDATVSLDGQLTVKLPQPVGRKTAAFGFGFPASFPSSRSINDSLRLLQPPLPRQWPPGGVPDHADAHAQATNLAGPDFAGVRDALEAGIAAHLPYGTVLSIDYQKRARLPYTYGLDADSTIWTGHYLAAEAFRYAATSSPDALARVKTILAGYQRNFDITRDAVVVDGKTTAVNGSYAGIFARSSLPDNDPHGDTEGRYDKRGSCYYEHPAGWKVGSRTYPTYAAALLGSRARVPAPAPLEPILFGFGCGSRGEQDHPLSRDQYLGLFMGLTYAYTLVPLPDVRAQVQSLFDPALRYILNHKWNVPLPPDGTITTTFIGDFDAQLALLRMGATVDPAAFAGDYARVAAAWDAAWIPVWFSTIDPLIGYFKFNLGHAGLGPAIFLENDPTLRAGLLRAYRILSAPTVLDRNAYFDLVDILGGAGSATGPSPSNPHLMLGDEVKSDLADWITRWRYVKGANGMPRNTTSPAAGTYLAQLWAGNATGANVRLYNDTNSHPGWFTTFPVPLWARPGNGMDFVWQRGPYGTGVDAPGSTRTARVSTATPVYRCAATPPSAAEIQACSADATREGPGIDYLLPYWLGVYLKVLPAA